LTKAELGRTSQAASPCYCQYQAQNCSAPEKVSGPVDMREAVVAVDLSFTNDKGGNKKYNTHSFRNDSSKTRNEEQVDDSERFGSSSLCG